MQELVGGYFDMRQECWYPCERLVTCPTCRGRCEVEVTYEPELDDLKVAA